MPWFIKTERFNRQTLNLSSEYRRQFLDNHKAWVIEMNATGINMISGYLVNKNKEPGGGGLLIVEATSYEEAEAIIKQDPMIMNDLVTWKIQEWIPVAGEEIKNSITYHLG